MRGSLKLFPWLPTALGVAALLAGLVIAAMRLLPGGGDEALPPPPPLIFPDVSSSPRPPAGPQSSPATPSSGPDVAPPAFSRPAATRPVSSRRSTSPPATRPDPAPVRPRPNPAPGRPDPAPQQAGPVNGRYRVMNSYGDSFIGEVLVTNTTGQERGWTVVLRFPAGVGDLRTSWLESLPQPSLSRSGDTFTWRSSVPLTAHGQGALRFHFDRTSGGDRPQRCTVNGSACRS